MRFLYMMRRGVYVGLILALALALLPGTSFAQSATPVVDVPENPKEGVSAKGKDDEGKKDGEKGDDAEKDGEKEEKNTVAINLNKVNIDQIVKFLTEITGKFVVKQKDVNAQISVFSAEEVSKEKAFQLITEALLMEKVAVVETPDTIRLVPTEMLQDVVVELQPSALDQVSAGIVKTVIPVRFADVTEIEELVKPLLSKTGSILAHAPSKQLIITDTGTRVANIKAVIEQLDVLETEDTQVDIVELKHASAEALAPIVQSILAAMMEKAGGGGGAAKPPQPGQPPSGDKKGGGATAQVVPYKEANWLVIVAPKEILAAAKPLVEQLDADRPDDLTLRIIQIKFASAEDVAAQLRPLFEKRRDKRPKDTVEVTAHSRSSSLLVRSSEENFELIKTIVAQLDTEESVNMITKTYELEHADADDIADQMNELYQGLESQSRRSWWYSSYSRGDDEKTRFVAERRTNSVIAIAKPTEIPKIDEMIEKLDEPIDADQVAPRIYRLNFVDATELTEVLNEIFGVEEDSDSGYWSYWYGSSDDSGNEVGRLYGKVRFVPESTTNSIIVTTNNQENFRVIEQVLKELDQFNPDAANTMVVVLQNANAEDVADQLNSLFAQQGARVPQQGQQEEESRRSSYYNWLYGNQKKQDEREISNLIGQVRVVPDRRTNALIITTALQNFSLIEKLVKELDDPSPKVLVRVRLLEVTTTRAKRVGTRYSSDQSIFETDDFDNGLRAGGGIEWADVYENGTISASSDLDINVLIQFMQRIADTRVLSEPTLVMNNNELGTLFVGSQIPFITDSQTSSEGSLNQSFEYQDAGTKMEITPNINELDKVEMKISLESTQIRPGEVLFGGFILDTRKFDTQIALDSGDTIVIGGIMRETESESIRRVPILGQIPVLNLVFRKKDTKVENTELIAFITPTVLREEGKAPDVTRDAAARVKTIREWRRLPESLDDLNAPPPWWKRGGDKQDKGDEPADTGEAAKGEDTPKESDEKAG